MKKLIMGMIVTIVMLGFVSCDNVLNNDELESAVIEFNDDNDLLAVEAVTAATLLDYRQVSLLSVAPLSETAQEEIIDGEIDEIDQYLEMMDSFLGDNHGLSTETLESDRLEYQSLLSFTTVNMLGEEVVYYIYFNEEVYEYETDSEGMETTEDENGTEALETTENELLSSKTKAFNFEDTDDDCVVYSIQGLIVYGDSEYLLEGKKILTDDLKEVVRLRAYIDHDNFVKVNYQIDSDDSHQKFYFEVREEGIIITKSKVMVVEEQGNMVVHLTFEDETGLYKYKFNILEEEGMSFIHVKYDIKLEDETKESGNVHIQITVNSETGEKIYTYKILEKNGNGNGNQYRGEIEKSRGNNSSSTQKS